MSRTNEYVNVLYSETVLTLLRCHCNLCQTFTSSAFSIGLVVPAEAFEIVDPQKLLKTFEDANALNGIGYRIAFCSKCGCYLFHEPVCLAN
jgi:hypothetical protein